MLLGVDGSACCKAATRIALDLLARVDGAELTALTVVNVVTSSGSFLKDLAGRLGFEPAVVPPEVEQRFVEQAEELLAGIQARAEAQGLHVKTVLEHGAVLDRILHAARQADLLVIGNRGETEERFPGQGGAHVYDVVASAPCPVLIAPEGAEPVRHVVIGYDGSVAASHALGALRRLTDKIPLEVHAVLVDRDGHGDPHVLDVVAEQLPGAVVRTHVVQASMVREGVLKLAAQEHANLLAVGFEGKSRLRDFLFGSTAEYLLTDHSLMLLVAH